MDFRCLIVPSMLSRCSLILGSIPEDQFLTKSSSMSMISIYHIAHKTCYKGLQGKDTTRRISRPRGGGDRPSLPVLCLCKYLIGWGRMASIGSKISDISL